MNKTQLKLIQNYKNQFPNDTYKIISNKTGIQQTRIFRIFNGSEMKLSEFQALDDQIKSSAKANFSDFRKITSQCVETLNIKELGELMLEMKYLLNLKAL